MAFRLTVAAGFLVVAMMGPALGDTIADDVAAISGSVEDVRILGTWERGDEIGFYRVVITRQHGASLSTRLFVQWISYPEGNPRIDQSTEIAELPELNLDVIDYNWESDSDGLSLYLEMVDASGGFDETYELHVFSPTDYIFGPATN